MNDFWCFAIVFVIFGAIIGVVYYAIDMGGIDYSEECMREMAVNYCIEQGSYMGSYFSGTFDSEYFNCMGEERGRTGSEVYYSSEEKDYCRTKDSESNKRFKSKWELEGKIPLPSKRSTGQ